MKRLFIIVFCLCAASTHGIGQWHVAEQLDLTLSPNPDPNVYALTGGMISFTDGVLWAGCSKLMRSNDTGKSWQTVALPTPPSTTWIESIRFLDRQNGLVSTKNGTILTSDGGTTWRMLNDKKTNDAVFNGSPNIIVMLQSLP